MKKGSKKQSNVTRVLNFFKEGDENEVAAVLILMGSIVNSRHIPSLGVSSIINEKALPAQRRRRARLNGADHRDSSTPDVESHKERVAHALSSHNEGEMKI